MIRTLKFGRALLAGLLGTAAMTILMYGWPLVGFPTMDIIGALGGVFPFDLSPYFLGSLVHGGMGTSLALIYALLFDPWLPGPRWFRGALFSILPWLFAITLLGPSLLLASEFLKGKEAVAANPCSVSNPCAVRSLNPCSVNQAKSNPCAPKVSNPCGVNGGVNANPCAVANPCGSGSAPSSGPSPEAMSLVVHLLYGAVLGVAYKPSKT